MIRPVSLWSRRGCDFLDALAEPKHEARPCSLGGSFPIGRGRFLTELILQPHLQPLGVAFLAFGRSRVGEYGGKRSQFPVKGRGSASIVTNPHVPTPRRFNGNSLKPQPIAAAVEWERPSVPQTEGLQNVICRRALRRCRRCKRVDRHADQDALQRIVRMPTREPRDGAKERYCCAQPEQRGVSGKIGRTQPIMLARMGELVSEEPSAVSGEQGRLHDDDVPDRHGPPRWKTSDRQAIERRARGPTADELRSPAAQHPGQRMTDKVRRRGPHAAQGADRTRSARFRYREASHRPRPYLRQRTQRPAAGIRLSVT
jgi:hypothetical protein